MGRFCQREELVEVIRSAQRLVLLTHNDPDGDGLGSQLALSRGLKRLQKEIRIINVGRLQPTYVWLLEEGEMEFHPRGGPFPTSLEGDLLLGVDFNGWERLLEFSSVIKGSGIPTAVIDHHPSDTASSDHTWIDTSAAATGLMVCELLEDLGVEIDLEIALPVYVSMITDTGSFRFSNTDQRAHNLAGRLLAAGVRPAEIHRRIFEGSSEERLRLMARALTGLQTGREGKIAWIVVSDEDLKATGATPEDTEGFMDVLRTLETLEVGAMFRTTEDGKIKVHFRSRGRIDVAQFATTLGGGGHPRAAGATFEMPLPEVVKMVIAALEMEFS